MDAIFDPCRGLKYHHGRDDIIETSSGERGNPTPPRLEMLTRAGAILVRVKGNLSASFVIIRRVQWQPGPRDRHYVVVEVPQSRL
jgi:hypothetical protein